MCMNRFVSNFPFLHGFAKKSISFGDSSITVYIGDKLYNNMHSPSAKYYIIDFDEQTENFDNVLASTSTFDEFQNMILEDEFYSVDSDLAYNLYIIIIVEDITRVRIRKKIQSNFTYGRKLIFEVEEAETFFRMQSDLVKREDLQSLKNLPDYSKLSAYRERIRADLNLFDELMIESRLRRERIRMKSLRSKKRSEVKDAFLNTVRLNRYFDYFLHESEATINTRISFKQLLHSTRHSNPWFDLDRILNLNIKNYRNFGAEKNISFGRVNLLYGENGAGKTSIIEAIEYALTGMLNNAREAKDGDADEMSINLECRDKDNKIFRVSKDDNKHNLAKRWYNVVGKEALNVAFSKYNYFDIRGAFRFALEDTNDPENSNGFYKFIVDEKVINLSDSLNEIKRQFTELEVALQDKIDEINEEYHRLPDKRGSQKHIALSNFDDEYLVSLVSILLTNRDNSIFNSDYLPELLNKGVEILTKQLKDCQKVIAILSELPDVNSSVDNIVSEIFYKIMGTFLLLTSNRDYSHLQLDEKSMSAKKVRSSTSVTLSGLSAGQKVSLALATMFSLFYSNANAPNLIILDEPVAHLDELHLLNLLDVLRLVACSGTQIFFTTSNPNTAQLFRRKFSFMGDEFSHFMITDEGSTTDITVARYSPDKEAPTYIDQI